MIWYVAEDAIYYEFAKARSDIFAKYEKVIILPTNNDVSTFYGNKNIAFLSNNYPDTELINLFVVKELENKYGMLTTQEYNENINIEESIELKLGIKTTQPKLNFSNLAGAERFKKHCYLIQDMKKKNRSIKATLLVGVPGAGKSYGVQCVAGEFKIPLSQLNLSLIGQGRNPIKQLNKIFEYFQRHNEECVLLIDEIEQMIENKSMMGEMLTILNDLNTENGYKFDGYIFATSNNISEISLKTPQFFRHGRWGEKFFVNYPKKQEALDIMLLYRNKYYIDFMTKEHIELIYVKINTIYKEYNINEQLCPFAGSEIDYLMEKFSYLDDFSNIQTINQIIEGVQPLQKTAHAGIQLLLADAKRTSFVEM